MTIQSYLSRVSTKQSGSVQFDKHYDHVCIVKRCTVWVLWKHKTDLRFRYGLGFKGTIPKVLGGNAAFNSVYVFWHTLNEGMDLSSTESEMVQSVSNSLQLYVMMIRERQKQAKSVQRFVKTRKSQENRPDAWKDLCLHSSDTALKWRGDVWLLSVRSKAGFRITLLYSPKPLQPDVGLLINFRHSCWQHLVTGTRPPGKKNEPCSTFAAECNITLMAPINSMKLQFSADYSVTWMGYYRSGCILDRG